MGTSDGLGEPWTQRREQKFNVWLPILMLQCSKDGQWRDRHAGEAGILGFFGGWKLKNLSEMVVGCPPPSPDLPFFSGGGWGDPLAGGTNTPNPLESWQRFSEARRCLSPTLKCGKKPELHLLHCVYVHSNTNMAAPRSPLFPFRLYQTTATFGNASMIL